MTMLFKTVRLQLWIAATLTLTRCALWTSLAQPVPPGPDGPPDGEREFRDPPARRMGPARSEEPRFSHCPCCEQMMQRGGPAYFGGGPRRGQPDSERRGDWHPPFFGENRESDRGPWTGHPAVRERLRARLEELRRQGRNEEAANLERRVREGRFPGGPGMGGMGMPPGMGPGPGMGFGGGMQPTPVMPNMPGMGGIGGGPGMPGMAGGGRGGIPPMGAMGFGGGMGGGGPEGERARHFQEAINHLQAAGLHDIADKLAAQLKGKFQPEDGKPVQALLEQHKKLAGQIQKLQQQTEKLQRGLEELREHAPGNEEEKEKKGDDTGKKKEKEE